ncbi:MAG TPA: right-handed parallel beta-helix repeat-containing protein [Anaerolineales bacterium]|nr:right-handed parallel beta-helix repeat-containing protein [Anaerolineales bacterium]
MNNRFFIGSFSLMALAVLLASAVSPVAVFADGGTPPPAVPATGGRNPRTTRPPDSLPQLPPGTKVIITDPNGNDLPLGSQAAADLLASGDPVWCPGTYDGSHSGYTLPGGSGCTGSFSEFNSTGGLLAELQSNPTIYSGNGTIYIEYTYVPGSDDAGGVTLNGSSLQSGGANGNLGSIVLQGGWNFGTNAVSSVQNYTDFGAAPLAVTGWSGDVTINNITISNASSIGLTVQTTGKIRLHHVNSTENSGGGASLNNIAGSSSSISVDDSSFDNDALGGLVASSSGDITLTGVTASNNPGDYGALLENDLGGGSIQVTSSTFSNNGIELSNGHGLIANSNGDIMLKDVTASGNGYDGAYLEDDYGTGSISIRSSYFDGNGNNGLEAYSNGDITLQNVTTDNNGGNGAQLGTPCFFYYEYEDGCDAITTGTVTVKNSSFNNNEGNGSQADCLITLCGGGLFVYTAGEVQLTNVQASFNAQDQSLDGFGAGAVIFNLFGDSPVEIKGTNVFSQNGLVGLFVWSDSDINVSGVTADANGDGGTFLTNSDLFLASFGSGNSINVSKSHFDNNSEVGLGLEAAGNANVSCSSADNNDTGVSGDVPGTFKLNSFELNGNTTANSVHSGALVVHSSNCSSNGGSISGPPYNVIPIPDTGGPSNALDCADYTGTELVLPNGDMALLPCPIGASASLVHILQAKLPGSLNGKYTFVSAVNLDVTPSLSGTATVSFKIPAAEEGSTFAILHWNGTEWVNLGGSATPPGYFSVDTSLSGDFLLVTQ